MNTRKAVFPVLIGISACHLLNDMMQSLIAAIYPLIKETYQLDFRQIGLITLAFQVTASVLQPVVGHITDRRPQPYAMFFGMSLTLSGLLILSVASNYSMLLLGAGMVGCGSAIFHPEATRIVRHASGGRHGLAQGIFQVGGQMGAALGPLIAAFIVVPRGQASLSWFSLSAFLALAVIWRINHWHRANLVPWQKTVVEAETPKPSAAIRLSALAISPILLLILLLFSKNAYSSSISNYYTFFLIDRFGISIQASQLLLFVFFVSSALGSVVGGYIGDRVGRRRIIWFSILGALPFTLALPYASLTLTPFLTIIINLIMASAFPAILVYAMELLPGRTGFIGGLFYGLSFGLGGIAATLLGALADVTSIGTVYHLCSFLPILGMLAWFLPNLEERR